MKTKDKNDKIREPYPPEQTPNPPQIIDPNVRNERNEPNAPVEERKGSGNPQGEDESEKDTGKRLGDPMEIDDETTI